jgi:hypothetical protein
LILINDFNGRHNNISIFKSCPKFIVAALRVYFVIFLGVGSRDKNGDAAATEALFIPRSSQENNKIDQQSSHNEFWTRFRDIVASTIKIIDEIQMCSNIMEQPHQNSLLCQ